MDDHTNSIGMQTNSILLIDWINCVGFFGQLRIPSLLFSSCVGRLVRGNNPLMLSHSNTKTERERGRLSPQAKLTQTDNFKVKTVVYLVKGTGGGERGKKERKFI